MTPAELQALNQQVLWAAFGVAFAFGALVQRTGFCTMGAVSDAVAMGEYTRLRQWALAAAVATFGFAALAAGGILLPPQTLYASTRWLWLSALFGGALFGFGMVLSSGCVSKTLVRVGGGSLKSLVVVLVAAIAAFATLRGLTAVWRVNTVDRVAVDFGANADLATLLARATGMGSTGAALAGAALVGGALLAFALATREARRPHNLLAGAGVGALVLAMWWVTGSLGHLAEHPETLEEAWLATNSRRAEGLSFVSPTAFALDWLIFFSDASKRLTVGIVSVLGVVAGSAVVALARRRFRWEGFANTPDLGHHLAGGVFMGIGGVTALGCSIGQGVTGLSTLSLTSLVAAAAMVSGAVAGVKYQMWRLERDTG
ncbi:YeeE/YedE family protein [Ramlibacter sp. USB13]|uniref:YeeE/YedE family protein n=1 Tax=Ramlibacter cellulosilyticus TaxID=2764187 RepID=A0A923MQA8_9BURK|nr:YeeE/YedE family protein [Ramlibacter cellulosilyticus]MBC5783842.1 YeeE/YedE family protein [Ramlibacter cellulosilyticus]